MNMRKLINVIGGKWSVAAVLLAGLCLGGSGIGTASAVLAEKSTPALRIPVIDRPPVLDGDLSDAAWCQAAEIQTFNRLGKTGGTVDQRAMLMTDGTWLFVAYAIAHPAPQEIKPGVLANPTRSLSVVQDDSVEVFFDPGTAGKLYFQFGLNAANVGGARRNISGAAAAEIAPGIIPWRHAARITDRGWNAELAIPLTVLASFGDLSRARMNLCINRKLPMRTVADVTSGHEREHSSWVPLAGGYHAPGSFAHINGLGELKINVPFFPVLLNAAVSGYSLQNNAYTITVELMNAFGAPGAAEVVIHSGTSPATSITVRKTMELGGGETRSLELGVPASAPGARRLAVEVRDVNADAILQTAILTEEQMAGLDLLAAYFDRSYYTDESAAQAVCQVNVADADMHLLRVRVRDAAGHEIASPPATKHTLLAIPLAGLADTPHDYTIELCRMDDQTVLAAQTLTLDKKVPQPGREWKIDRVNRVLLENGAPFFPFGICAAIALDDAAGWRELGTAFNCIVSWNRKMKDAAQVRQYAATAAAHGLRLIPRTHEFFEDLPRGEKITEASGYAALTQAHLERVLAVQAPRVVAGVEGLMSASNVMGCFVWDEPRYAQYDQSVPGRALNGIVKRLDGYRPTFVNYAAYIPEGDQYTDWFDVLLTDPYWIPAGPVNIGTPNWVSRRTHEINLLAAPARFRQPIIIVPMAGHWSATVKRAILPREQRAQTYLALIHGAKGIIYWYYPVIHQQLFDAFVALGAEMQKLAPAIVAPDVPQHVTYLPREFNPSTDTYPDVQVALHRDPAGHYVMLAANSRPWPVDVSYTLADLGEGTMIKNMFDDTQFTAAAGKFAARLAGYDTRAYTFAGAARPDTGRPAAITVEAVADMAGYVAEPSGVSIAGRSGRKNLLPNSSFEECALPGWPDYIGIMAHKTLTTVNRVGGPAPFFQAVAEDPVHGLNCLKITPDQSPEHRARLGNRDGIAIRITPQETVPREYVFSVWLRGSRTGMKANIFYTGWRPVDFDLTTEWRRYHIQGVMQPGANNDKLFYIRAGSGRNAADGEPGDVLWVDAMQLERGAAPTEYEP